MKVSIITISYNQSTFLRQCIDSVLNQDYEHIEYIVVDPGSGDGSREIIDSYGAKIKKVYVKDSGPAEGLNNGFQYASGDVYGFINADDQLLPGAISCIAKYLESNKHVDVVSGCGYFTDRNGVRLRRIIPSRLTAWLYVRGGVSVFQQGTFFRSNWYKKVGGFNEGNKTSWDGELFLDMAISGAKFKTIGDDLALFRLHDEGITGSGRLNKIYAQDVERLFAKCMGREKNFYDQIIQIFARRLKYIADPMYLIRRIGSKF